MVENINQGFSLFFCLLIRIRKIMTDSDGPKKHTDPTDPDPQHWFHYIMMQFYGCTVTTHLDFMCVCTCK
jgi:hypothetical protein